MKILSSDIVLRTPIFYIIKKKLLFPNGKNKTYWYINSTPNVNIIAVTNDKKIIFIKQKRGNNKSRLEFPGGILRNFRNSLNEAKKKALQELEEETGYKALNIDLLKSVILSDSWIKRKYFIFIAWNLEYVGQKLSIDEDIQVMEIKIKNILENINNLGLAYYQDVYLLKEGLTKLAENKIINMSDL